MATRIDIRRRNKAKRIFKKNAKTTIKVLIGLILSIILLVAVFVGVVFLSHNAKTNDDIKKLTDAGLYNIVQLDDGRKMNASIYGDKNKEYIIVPIGGIGVQDFSVYAQHISLNIKNRICMAFVDRAGYGFSSDTAKKQTVEQIVSDYRECLQKTDVKGPYILMAHEFGGVYATYWASMYPDEIKGIIYLDGTIISSETEIKEYKFTKEDTYKSMLCKIGFQRVLYNDYYNCSSKVLSAQEAECSRAMNIHSIKTNAQMSELKLMKQNLEKTLAAIEKNDIPKLYLSATNGFQTKEEAEEFFKFKNQQNAEIGEKVFFDFNREESTKQKEIEEFINKSLSNYNNITALAENLGNCKVARIPGDSKIYEQKPEGITDAIIDFAWFLQGDSSRIKSVYEDTKAINWENFNKEHGN